MIHAAPGISASPCEDNLRYFNVIILGPQNTPYEGMLWSSSCVCCFLPMPRSVQQYALIVDDEAYTPDSPGGTFKLELFLPEDYPMAPPKVTPVLY